jgi:hypothetical protein
MSCSKNCVRSCCSLLVKENNNMNQVSEKQFKNKKEIISNHLLNDPKYHLCKTIISEIINPKLNFTNQTVLAYTKDCNKVKVEDNKIISECKSDAVDTFCCNNHLKLKLNNMEFLHKGICIFGPFCSKKNSKDSICKNLLHSETVDIHLSLLYKIKRIKDIYISIYRYQLNIKECVNKLNKPNDNVNYQKVISKDLENNSSDNEKKINNTKNIKKSIDNNKKEDKNILKDEKKNDDKRSIILNKINNLKPKEFSSNDENEKLHNKIKVNSSKIDISLKLHRLLVIDLYYPDDFLNNFINYLCNQYQGDLETINTFNHIIGNYPNIINKKNIKEFEEHKKNLGFQILSIYENIILQNNHSLINLEILNKEKTKKLNLVSFTELINTDKNDCPCGVKYLCDLKHKTYVMNIVIQKNKDDSSISDDKSFFNMFPNECNLRHKDDFTTDNLTDKLFEVVKILKKQDENSINLKLQELFLNRN